MKRLLCAVSALLIATSCSSPKATRHSDETAGPGSTLSTAPRAGALTREQALTRARQIGKVAYQLWFGLDGEAPEFSGRTIITFELREKGRDISNELLVDLDGATLKSLALNGQKIDDPAAAERYDGHRLRIRARDLKPGSNRLEIAYTRPYSTNGNGLHRFKDPADGLPYLYTNFEPYHAHDLFPCFDQPDLKATYELTVETPEGWKVIANTLEKETNKVDGRRSWSFPVSPVFSTYVFAMHAGPYQSWKGDAGGIPIRLFARKSLAKYVDWQEWLSVTRKGLEFYGTQFGYPYPYGKYDQIIVPDFNAGAMENVGAVTFSERAIYRTKVTADRHRHRADTILHEMAHMWFGDLVTMRWWNGLWLNESFATFMAAWAVDKATDFQGSWQGFFAGMKEWGYWEDQLVTTHPIEVSVPDTDHAFANFDGVTYGKGAAALKQLFFTLGEDNFREGLQRYFMKYANRNTTLADFMKTLGEASGRHLGTWEQQWLKTTGVNSVEAEWACEANPRNGKLHLSKLVLKQGPSEGNNELREHHAKVALYQRARGTGPRGPLKAVETLDVAYSKARTEIDLEKNVPCPDLVFPNHEDYDYVKVSLDEKSLKAARRSLAQIDDPFARQMFWQTLWAMVVDGKLAATEFADIAMTQGASEKDTQVLSKILGNLVRARSERASVVKYTTGEARDRYAARIEAFLRSHALTAPAGSDLQLVWYAAWLESAHSKASLALAKGLLDGSRSLKGFEVDQERRWDLVQVLARNGAKNAQALIDGELKEDATDMGQKQAIAAEAAMPDPAMKQRWLARITHAAPAPGAAPEAAYKPAQLREAMDSYHLIGQEELTRQSVDAYFESLVRLGPIEDEDYLADLAGDFYPSLCEPALVERTTRFLDEHPGLPATIVKNLRVRRQEEERCIRARKLVAGETPVAMK